MFNFTIWPPDLYINKVNYFESLEIIFPRQKIIKILAHKLQNSPGLSQYKKIP